MEYAYELLYSPVTAKMMVYELVTVFKLDAAHCTSPKKRKAFLNVRQ